MDELISKRAVIEAIEKARANVGHNLERSIGKSIIEILDDVGRDIDRLPSALGTNLAEVGTDTISRQQAIDDIWTVSPLARLDRKWVDRWLRQLPSAQPTFDARDTQYNLPIGTGLISRQALLDKFEPWLKVKDYNDGELNMLKAILYEIRFMRSAQPKIGRWIHDGSKWTNRWICSECGYKWFFDCIEGAYCPNCGAKMEVTT